MECQIDASVENFLLTPRWEFANNPNLTQITVLGKSEAPEGFDENWNAEDYYGRQFYDVIYKP